MLAKRLLQRMKAAIGPDKPLDRSDLRAARLNRKYRAGLHRFAVHIHRTSATMAGVAADMRTGNPELLAQQVDQQQAWLSEEFDIPFVDRQFDVHFGHCCPPSSAGALYGSGNRPPDRHPRDMDAEINWPMSVGR